MRELSRSMSGWGAGLRDFDNDGWKDLFVTRGHVESLTRPGQEVNQYNTVFGNLGSSGRWQALTEEAGSPPRPRHDTVDAPLATWTVTAELMSWRQRSNGRPRHPRVLTSRFANQAG